MPKLSLRTFLVVLLVVCLARVLFPAARTYFGSALRKLTGLDLSSETLIETMGNDLSTEGIRDSIIYAFDFALDNKMYPVGGLK